MTLQSSGPISMGQIRDEYQLSNPISLSQGYGKPDLPGSGPISMGNFYGKSYYLDRQTVTVAQFSINGFTCWGYRPGNGSVSDGTCDLYGGASFAGLYVMYAGSHYLRFYVNSNQRTKDWTRMELNGITYFRANATGGESQSLNLSTFEWDVGQTYAPYGNIVGAQKVVTWY